MLQQLHVLLVLGAPELDAGLSGGVSAERGRGAESPPSTCAHAAGDAAQGTADLLGCERTLVAHVQLFIQQYAQVLLGGAALNPLIP